MQNQHTFIKALKRQPTEFTPIWIMRQAGRYLPEYRALRAKFPRFMDMCKNPQAACEVTLMPMNQFDLDAAIIFSDILTIPDAMNLGLEFKQGEGPVFEKPLRTVDAINAITMPDIESELHYVFDAIKETSNALAGKKPLIGFAGSPWTMATYMVEGGSSKTFDQIKRLLYVAPDAAHHLLNVLTDSVIVYLQAQINAGADAVMIFDTWGGVLTGREYKTFSLAYMSQITSALKQSHPDIPVVLFTKNGGLWLSEIADSGCDAVGLDWTMDIAKAKSIVGDRVALQGNMDPCILYSTPDRIRQEVADILGQFGNAPGHVFNLGHGIYPDVSPDNVRVLVDSVHEISRQYTQHGSFLHV